MTKFGGILIDYDSVIQASVDLEGRPLIPEMSESQCEFRATLDELAARGFPIAYESMQDSRALGSNIFRENLSCDAYIGESPEKDEIDMRLETVQDHVKNSDQFIYVCNNSNRLQVALGMGYKCVTSRTLVTLRSDLFSRSPEERRNFTRKSLVDHLEKATQRTSGLLLPMLPARFITNSEIESDSSRWNNTAMPLLNMIAPPKVDEKTGIQYFMPYYSEAASLQLGFKLWKNVKDWNGHESGPRPNLIDLNFIAATMSAGLWNQGNQAISYIPASTATKQKPAAASTHLAQRISYFLGIPLLHLLTRTGHQSFEARSSEVSLQSFAKVAAIDDQVTKGVSMSQGLDLMASQFPNAVFSPTVWSKSMKH